MWMKRQEVPLNVVGSSRDEEIKKISLFGKLMFSFSFGD
jgi:hypothetical protein